MPLRNDPFSEKRVLAGETFEDIVALKFSPNKNAGVDSLLKQLASCKDTYRV